LIVALPRPLDRALLLRMITVADAGSTDMDGDITLANDERLWKFQPAQPWSAGQFSLLVDTTLEDSAGNNLQRPFEVDVFERVDDRVGPQFLRIPFRVVLPVTNDK